MKAGVLCGEPWWSIRSWRRTDVYRKTASGFCIGPILFYKQ